VVSVGLDSPKLLDLVAPDDPSSPLADGIRHQSAIHSTAQFLRSAGLMLFRGLRRRWVAARQFHHKGVSGGATLVADAVYCVLAILAKDPENAPSGRELQGPS
jgi:hypothetical protein